MSSHMYDKKILPLLFLIIGCESSQSTQNNRGAVDSSVVINGDLSLLQEQNQEQNQERSSDLGTDQIDSSLDLSSSTDSLVHSCQHEETISATARCLSPQQSAEYYVDQAHQYFDTLDVDADRQRVPIYSEYVIRWEWPPWLLLTGFGREEMISTSDALRRLDPSTVPIRECRAFSVQPFARCYIVFEYEEGLCPIYEEFTFNDQGEMTFIEAWSDLPTHLPMNSEEDRWAEGDAVHRLSTRVLGLGNEQGLVDLESDRLQEAIAQDEDLADLINRSRDWWRAWAEELRDADEDFFARGCGW